MPRKSTRPKLKLPKRLLGARLPKGARKQVNSLLKHVPASHAKPIVAVAVAVVAMALLERLGAPLNGFLNRFRGAAIADRNAVSEPVSLLPGISFALSE